MKIRYFDHAATTAVKEDVLKEMLPYFSLNYGNPSSLYSIGRKAKKGVEQARQRVANAIGAEKSEIYFTGCGSESDNTVIKGIAKENRKKGNHIITSKIEHPAILNACKTMEKEGFRVTYLGVNDKGEISLEELKNSITKDTVLISIMFANNEIGTIQPIKEIGKIAKHNNIIFHTDAVQAVGNVRINVKEMNIDMLSMSAHKFYGPKGVGALYVKNGIEFQKFQDGGHQERDKRAGTENVAGIVGLGKAIDLAYKDFDGKNKKILELREYCISQIIEKIPKTKLNGHENKRLPGNINISFETEDAEMLLWKLDKKGICISTGSACSSGKAEPSHVLVSIGLPKEIANSSIRITLGDENTKEDIDYLVNALIEIVENK